MRFIYFRFLFMIITDINYVCCFLVPDGKVSVQTKVGEIVGFSTVMDVNGSQEVLHTFLGIPYAQTPTGTNRFRKPIAHAPFDRPIDASKFGPACMQLISEGSENLIDTNLTYSEDCLYLNIYAPGRLPANSHSYPTMIWIHGGGFVIGYSNFYDGGALSLSGEVIVVTINYRLNAFGFLSTEDPNSKGNMGLFDQQLAIRWVHDNIQAFGGDPNRITIFGESAGSASVAYQTIYPVNKGLFHRAIAESGSFSSPWAFIKPEKAHKQARRFATSVGCLQTDDVFLVKCLQSKSLSTLTTAMSKLAYDGEIQEWPPVTDNEFILDEPKKMFSGSFPSKEVENMFFGVDLIMGVNNKEGLVQYPAFNKSSTLNFNKSYIDEKLVPERLKYTMDKNVSSLASIKGAILLEYTDWENFNDNKKQYERFVDIISDQSFFVPAAQTAQKHTLSAMKNTYVYELSAAPPFHLLPIYQETDGPMIANHADDITFLFSPWFDRNYDFGYNISVTDEQKLIGKAMVTMLTNFAKTGDPNMPQDITNYLKTAWPLFEMTSQKYLNITPYLSPNSVGERFAARQVQFWTKLIPSIEKAALANTV